MLSDLKLLRSSKFRFSYLPASSFVRSSPRAMMASMSSSMKELELEGCQPGFPSSRGCKGVQEETYFESCLMIFSAPCWIMSRRSSLFWAALAAC
jgi:hypothetical protein